MISDPIFIISMIGMAAVLVAWIIGETKESYKDNYVANNSSVLINNFWINDAL